MKFMSDFKELEGKIYNSINECKDAESAVLKQREELANKERDKSKLKKKFADEIDKAEEAVKAAYKEYDVAKEKAAKILEDSNKQVLEIINAAKDVVNKAEKAKLDAITAFNKEFGAYQKVYTGEQARAELERFNSNLNSLFGDLFKFWF